MKRLVAFVLALVMVLSVLPANMIVAASAESAVVTLTADDARIHRSTVVNAPALEGEEYKLSISRSNVWYDYNTRKVIPSIYNLRELMTDKVGTSSDKGINRYPYVVTKVNVVEAGYYDLGVKINMNSAAVVNTLAIVVDGTVHVAYAEKTGSKQTVVAENVYLTQGEHSILYTSVIPQNESEALLGQEKAVYDTYYPWTNFWAFTYEGAAALEILDASTLTGTDVENIFKGSTRVEAEDTQYVIWNTYSAAETNGAASGDTVVGGLYYSQIKQTFDDLVTNGLDKTKTPYLQYTVEAPAAGTYYVTVGAYIGTNTNNDNPVPYIAVIANDNAPVKAQFDGAWNGMDSATVAVELEQGINVIRCTSVTPDQYSEGTAWVNQDYIELQNGLTAKRTNVTAEDEDWDAYLYLNRYADCETKFADPGSNTIYPDMVWDYPSLYEEMYGVYSEVLPAKADRWPYIAFQVYAGRAGEYQVSAKIATSSAAETIGMIVDGAMHVVDVVTTSGVLTQSVYLTQGTHTVIFTSPIPRDMVLASTNAGALYPWMDFYAFSLDDGLSFAEVPTLETIQSSVQNDSRIEANDSVYANANGNYAANISKEYTRRYNSPYTATVKGAAGAAIDGSATAGEKQVNTAQTYADLSAGNLNKDLTSYVRYDVIAPQAGTYTIRVGAYLEGSGTMPYGTVLVNGVAYKAQFAGSWNGYDAVNLAVELREGANTILCIGITADQTDSDGWIGYDFIDLPATVTGNSGRKAVSAADEDWADYLYLNRYTDSGSNFGGPNYNDMRWDYPSLYEDMYGVYSDVLPDKAGRWPYIALRVATEEAGYYQISAQIETSAGETVGMIVDGAMHAVDVVSKQVTESVYLSEGAHVIIFTAPIPRDMGIATTNNSALYPWMNYCSFKLSAGANFIAAPTLEQIQESTRTYSRIETEDSLYAAASGNYAANISKDYTRRYNSPYTATVKGAVGGAIDAAATNDEKQVNSAQTYADLVAGNLDKDQTSYVQYVISAPKAGTYTIRIGAYLEGSGTMPYGTVLVNGVAYKAQFCGDWNGYDAVNLAVKLSEGENVISLIGVTADQTATDGWIGYDYIDVPQGLSAELLTVSAASENWDAYLYLNMYADCGTKFGDPGSNTIYPDMRWDYPSLYEDMYGIYSDALPAKADRWPYIAFQVNAAQAGQYQISAQIATAADAKTIGMIVDGAMHVVEVTTTSGVLTQSVYLSEGKHVIIFTSPIPQDMELATSGTNALYRWMDFSAFSLADGLNFAEVPTLEEIQNSMGNDSRMEAEDFSYGIANGNYAADISKEYTRRYSTYTATIKGAAGAAIDGSATTDEKLVNSAQTYAEIQTGGLDKAQTSYVQYSVVAPKAGTYNIRVGAYLEGSGDMPYGTVLVNNVAYKAQFAGSWNGYDAVNLTVELAEGENTLQLIGITADQTASDGWIGYDFVDLPAGVIGEREEVSAADEDWESYLYLNSYQDDGANFGGATYSDMRYDYPSLYEDMLGIYSAAKPDRAGYWPYIAMRVSAAEAGYYPICAQIETAAAETVGMIVDGAMYDVDVVNKQVEKSVYLSAGEHVIIFTLPMPRDMELASVRNDALYPWINYCSFKISAALDFVEAPTVAQIQASMQNYSKLEAEDATAVTATGGYINETSKTYTRRYGTDVVKVKGQAGVVGASDYVEYKLYASEAGTYVIRIGAYLEGSGDMPYGTVVVNGVTYKAQFSGSWNGYDAVNLAVELAEGENVVQLLGISEDQTASEGWIGYDFVEIPAGLYFYESGEYTETSVDEGFTFEKRVTYQTDGTISNEPYSISAWIYLPTGYMTRGGVIFGNYVNSTTPYANFEIGENGVPRFTHVNGDGKSVDLYFDQVSVCADTWTNITFTISGNSISCYKNGVLAQTVTAVNDIDLTAVKNPYVLGGDLRASADGNPNGQYFKGRIIDVALFDVALSDEEVLNVYSDAQANETKPYTRYVLETAEIGKDVADEYGNNDLFVETPYFDKTPVTDYAYSFAVIGDTQIVTENDVTKGEDNLSKIYDWILENRESKNIQFVFGLGDITDNNSVAEWEAAQVQMQKMDAAGMPYSVIRGNHDLVGRNDSTNTDFMTQYLGSEAYKNQFAEGGFYDENISNSWRTFTVGTVNYLFIALDFGPTDELLAWAGDIIEAHPDHSVIITTHAYLYRDGTTLDADDAAAPSQYGEAYNDGDQMWEKLVSKYENIVLVMCGHDPSDNIIVSRDKGVNGNVVTSMLVDPQGIDNEDGSTGMVAMLYFSEDGKTVQVEYLSTVRAAQGEPAYLREINQFGFELISEEEVVYVDAVNGNDMAIGTADAPVKTLERALRFIGPDGTVSIVGDYAVADNFVWNAANGAVTVTGGKLDFSAQSAVNFGSAVTFDNINLVFADGAEVYFNGHKAVISENVTVTGLTKIFGGSKTGTVASTDLTVLSGTYQSIYGGSGGVTTSTATKITGEAKLVVGGNVNADVDVSDHSLNYNIYGGSLRGSVGSTNVTVNGNAKANMIYGGGSSYDGGWCDFGTTNLTVNGGSFMGIYGGNAFGPSLAGSNVNITINGGTMEQIFGGHEGADGNLQGDVNITLNGGTITRRVYGGSYNECDLSFDTDRHVVGNITLTITSGVNIDFSYSGNDLSIYAHSRHNAPSDEENSTIVFSTYAAYVKYGSKLGAQDSVMKLIMGNTTAADNIVIPEAPMDGVVETENGYSLEKDITTSEFTVDAGKVLDLNGHTLTVDNLVCFGSIIDTSEGNTGALVAGEMVLSDMTYMPIYDSANGCYKFYAYELNSLGTRSNADGSVTYGFAIDFANADAYALLSSGDCGVDVTMNLAWGENEEAFAFSAELLQQYAALQVKYPAMRAAMMLTVTGLDTLESGAALTVTPAVAADQVSVTGEEMVYTVA